LHNIAKSVFTFCPPPEQGCPLKIIICKRGSDSLFAYNSKFMNSLSTLASLQKGWTVEGGGSGLTPAAYSKISRDLR